MENQDFNHSWEIHPRKKTFWVVSWILTIFFGSISLALALMLVFKTSDEAAVGIIIALVVFLIFTIFCIISIISILYNKISVYGDCLRYQELFKRTIVVPLNKIKYIKISIKSGELWYDFYSTNQEKKIFSINITNYDGSDKLRSLVLEEKWTEWTTEQELRMAEMKTINEAPSTTNDFSGYLLAADARLEENRKIEAKIKQDSNNSNNLNTLQNELKTNEKEAKKLSMKPIKNIIIYVIIIVVAYTLIKIFFE